MRMILISGDTLIAWSFEAYTIAANVARGFERLIANKYEALRMHVRMYARAHAHAHTHNAHVRARKYRAPLGFIPLYDVPRV
jgi:hypothetical protein